MDTLLIHLQWLLVDHELPRYTISEYIWWMWRSKSYYVTKATGERMLVCVIYITISLSVLYYTSHFFFFRISSSEKVDKENRYSEFSILCMPYPGKSFFLNWYFHLIIPAVHFFRTLPPSLFYFSLLFICWFFASWF